MAGYSDEQRQSVEDWFAKKQTDTQAGNLSRKLSHKLKIPVLRIDQIIEDLLKEKLLTSASGFYHGKLTCHISPPVSESESQWRQVLQEEPGCIVLMPNHTDLADWSATDMEKLLTCLVELKAALPEAYGLSKYEASARYLMGSSKLLDSLDKKSLKQFGIDTDCFQTATTYVVIAGPENPEQVLLIENPQSFEACIRAGLHEQQALICTYGYGLQWSQVLENTEYVSALIRTGHQNQNLQALLNHADIYFWGDLDHAGIDIFQSIAKRVPTCKLSNLYLPMIEALIAGQGHPYTKAVKKEEQPLRNPIHGLSKAIDQEQFNDITTLTRYSQSGMTLQEFQARLSH